LFFVEIRVYIDTVPRIEEYDIPEEDMEKESPRFLS